MGTKTFFVTQVYHDKIEWNKPSQKNEELIKEVFKISEIDEDGLAWSETRYFGGYTSYSSYNRLQEFSSNFKELEDMIRPHLVKYISDLEYDIDPDSLEMSNCWANIMPQGTHHSGHIHPLSVISGTYYLQMPEDSSAIKFEDPRLPMLMNTPSKIEEAKPEHQSFVSVKAKDGDLVLFESYLRHEVPANQSEDDRISISFNFEYK